MSLVRGGGPLNHRLTCRKRWQAKPAGRGSCGAGLLWAGLLRGGADVAPSMGPAPSDSAASSALPKDAAPGGRTVRPRGVCLPIPSVTPLLFQKPYICKIPGCTKRYTDPSSLRKHVKTVHGPDAHVTKKQRNDVHLRTPLLRENGDSEAGAEPVRGSEGSAEASSTSQAVEDCLHVKAIKTERSGVSRAAQHRPGPYPAPRGRAQRHQGRKDVPPLSSSAGPHHHLGPPWNLFRARSHPAGQAVGDGDASPDAVSLQGVGRYPVSAFPTSTRRRRSCPRPSVLSLRPCPSGLHPFCSNHLFFVSTSFS